MTLDIWHLGEPSKKIFGQTWDFVPTHFSCLESLYIESMWWAERSRWSARRDGGAAINDSREPEFFPAANGHQGGEGSSHLQRGWRSLLEVGRSTSPRGGSCCYSTIAFIITDHHINREFIPPGIGKIHLPPAATISMLSHGYQWRCSVIHHRFKCSKAVL